LVQGPRPDVREATRAKINGSFRLNTHSPADGGHVGAGGGENGQKTRGVFAIISLTSAARAGTSYV
jgi:hypothetical protein